MSEINTAETIDQAEGPKTDPLVISLDILEDAPGQAELTRLHNERREAILPMVRELIPHRADQQIIASTARRSSYLLDGVPEGEQRDKLMALASSVKRSESDDRLAADLANTKIPIDELPAWLPIAYETAKSLSVAEEGVDRYTITNVLGSVDSLDELKVVQDLASHWHETIMSGATTEEAERYSNDALSLLNDLSGNLQYPRPEKRSEAETRELFAAFTELHAVAYQLPKKADGRPEISDAVAFLRSAGLKWHDSEPVKVGVSLIRESLNGPDQEVRVRFVEAIGRYGENHSLKAEQLPGWLQKLLPAMRRHEPQVDVLRGVGNYSGMGKGDFGALDFIVETYGAKVSPQAINELLMISREIPTSDMARLESNRKDALALAGHFLILRDFIHDQRPGVHDVLEAMVKYYETRDPATLESVIDRVDYFKNSERYRGALLNLSNYYLTIPKGGNGSEVESAIDILKRLEVNTRPVEVQAPEVSDHHLLRLLKQIEANPSDNHALEGALSYLNQSLIKQMEAGEVGIEPNNILAISWIEQKCFAQLQDVKYEQQMDAYKQTWFTQLLLFQELTASEKFDQGEFDKFLTKLSELKSDEAYKLIANRTIAHVQTLGKIYMEKGWQDKVGALWSGNTAHELIGLTDPRPASTKAGARLRVERSLPADERKTGD